MKNETASALMREAISEALGRGLSVTIHFAVQSVIDRYDALEGPDADFWLSNTYDNLSRIAKKCIGSYEAKTAAQPDAEQVPLLDGFEYLQKGYSVERDGQRVIVPTDKLTKREIMERAAELRATARGCLKHAMELEGLAATLPDDELPEAA